MTQSTQTWIDFEQFYFKYCLRHWSLASENLPYGTFLVFHPNDDASMLYAADLTKAAPKDIIHNIKKFGERYNVPIGFSITPSWTGDVDHFKSILADEGFHESHQILPFILDDFSGIDALPDSDFTIKPANDPQIVADIFQEGFRCPDDMAQIIYNSVQDQTPGPITTQFFVAYAPDGTPAGTASCNYDHRFGYMNCLSVREPYRRQKCASHLVKVRLQHLRDNGITSAVTKVLATNTGSIKTQEKIGYRKLITASIWKPKDCPYTKEF